MKVESGLIIAEPWIDKILQGTKVWEMRSRGTSKRGWIGLIRKGSKQVVGVACLDGVGAALSREEMLASVSQHGIPESMIRSGAVDSWNTPWKFSRVVRLARPVGYQHKSGAVTWVLLEEHVQREIALQMAGTGRQPPPAPASRAPQSSFQQKGDPRAWTRAAAPGFGREPDSPKLTHHSIRSVPRPAAPVADPSDLVGSIVLGGTEATTGSLAVGAFYGRLLTIARDGHVRVCTSANEIMHAVLDEKSRTLKDIPSWIPGLSFGGSEPIRRFLTINKARPGDWLKIHLNDDQDLTFKLESRA